MAYQTQITADWTQSVAARRILASFAKHPPQEVVIPPVARWDGRTRMHGGYRVECLRRLHNEYGDKLVAAFHDTDDYAPLSAFLHGQPTVDAAVDAALVLA